MFAVTLQAQQRTTLLNETFDSDEIPSGWTLSATGAENWSISKSNNAGGAANELFFYWKPNFTGVSRVITKPIDLSNAENVFVSMKHYLDVYSGSNKIGFATSTDGSSWNIAWEHDYTENGQYRVVEQISTPDLGKPEVYFCIFFDGTSTNIDYWYFDDFEVFVQENVHANMLSIDVDEYTYDKNIKAAFTIENRGSETIESFSVKTVVRNDETNETNIISQTFDTELASFESSQFVMDDSFELNPGVYMMYIDITEINNEDYSSDNEMSKKFNIAMGTCHKTPMIEHFSASTCGPCVAVNFAMEQLTDANPGRFTYTKYQISTDPYYTEEAGIRQHYYGVSAIPHMFLNGTDQGHTYLTQEILDSANEQTGYSNVRGAFNIEGNTINVIADFMSYVKMENVKAFISVNEKETNNNTGSNGETAFHHVFMKMLGSAEGNTININAGEYQRLEFSQDMSETNVEDMNDLEVSLWLQNPVTKEIYNSHFAYEYSGHCYPVQNLSATAQENGKGATFQVSWDAPESGSPVGYNIYFDGEMIEENYQQTSYQNNNLAESVLDHKSHVIEVVALYENDRNSVGVAKIIDGNNEVEIVCPTPSELSATVETDVTDYEHKYRVSMNWSSVDEAEMYVVYVNGTEAGRVNTNSYVAGFDEDGNYSFTVSSVCPVGESEQSEGYSFVLDGTSIDEYSNSFELFPNPVKDELTIVSSEAIESISIFDIRGICIMESDNVSERTNISNLNSGMYFIKIKTNDNEITRKFVKE